MTQLELISTAMQWSPTVYLFGGFAEDALLYGTLARPHTDIDLLVFIEELEPAFKNAAQLGFRTFETRWQVTPRGPLATGCISGGVNLEFCVMERSVDGRAFFDTPAPNGGLRRNWLPQDTFTFPPQKLDTVEVRVVSPMMLYQTRVILGEIFGMRPKDQAIQQELRQQLLTTVSEAALVPQSDLLR